MKALVFDNYKEKFNKINKYLKMDTIDFKIIKFKNGEGKILVNEEIKGEDLIIFSDFSNSTSYTYLNKKRKYSKDEYYVELKRLISALDDANSISVFLPLIYSCRQNTNNKLESKDYLMFIDDLKRMNVKNIITFCVHGENGNVKSYTLAPLFENKNYDVVVSPDKGGVARSEKYSDLLKCDNYYFEKIRDLNVIVDGINPIKKYSKSNYDFKGKKVLIVDDILDTGSTIINALNNIVGAKSVDIFICYALFNEKVKEFKKLVKENKLNKIYISDLIYLDKKILKNKFIEVIDTSELVAKLIGGIK